jgi:hypothetical protein
VTPGPPAGRRGEVPRGAVTAVVSRPGLWWTAVIQVAVLTRPGWWKRWPPIPRPDPGYLRFRLETAYGDPEAEIAASDVVEYLAWCREARLAAR